MIVDMHCHVIWGVDDGAQTEEDARAMIRLAAENKVRHIVCTSHITPGEAPFPLERYEDHLNRLQAWIREENLDITLYPGSEILYTEQAARMLHEGRIPRLNNRRVVLVEFWYDVPEDTMRQAARLLGNEDVTVIFAHIERYKASRNIAFLEELRDEFGVLIQMNARTIYEKQGFLTDRWKRKLLEGDLIDMVASDAHNVSSRPCNVLRAWEWLRDKFGGETADRLCGAAAAELLALES